jgi:peptidoglycan/xylan/chitin deacetylase (PgdA/CDA1 family)
MLTKKLQIKTKAVFGIFMLFCLLVSAPVTMAKGVALKKIALTFDDGPYGTPTTQILAILKKEKVHATFFVMGMNVEKYPDIARAIVKAGNLIGNHTYDHPKNLATDSLKAIDVELSKAENAITVATGKRPLWFRAPYGRTSPKMIKEVKSQGYKLVSWTVDPQDWDYQKSTPEMIIKTVLAQAAPNAIILMHDGRDIHVGYPRGNTVAALPLVIDALKKEGYTFVTVDQLDRLP